MAERKFEYEKDNYYKKDLKLVNLYQANRTFYPYIYNEKLFSIEIFLHDYVMPLHTHDFIELVYVLEGNGIHMQYDREEEITAGDFFVINYNTEHAYRPVEKKGFKIINIMFVPEFLDNMLTGKKNFNDILANYLINFSYTYFTNDITKIIFHDNDKKIFETINRILEEHNSDNVCKNEVIRTYLIQIIINMVRKTSRREIHESKNYKNYINYIMEYVNNHYNEKIHLSELAKNLNYSISYVSEEFKKNTGVCFNDYLQKVRIDHSCRLLANSKMKIIDIANAVGYNDVNFFCSVFKKNLGMSPSTFRKTHSSTSNTK